ncbi:MAG TPA: DUF5317 domain-containing protein [Candidatus Caenarcaniphilales bacterium]|nr:DUF5317 domain-containing protein [Candidatus Caenarcaniphilales bacterium]
MLLLYFVAAGLLVGLAAGGRLSPLARVRVEWWPVALAGLAFQLLLFGPPLAGIVGDFGPALYVGSSVVVLGALLRNVRHPGFALIALGAALNLVVIVANGGQMPAAPEAFALLTGTPELPVEHFSNSVLAGAQTRLAFLGDIFVLPRPIPFANVFSIGDVAIGLGGALFIVRTMRGSGPAVAESGGSATAIG